MKTMIPVIKIINRSPIRAIFNIVSVHWHGWSDAPHTRNIHQRSLDTTIYY